ncbi:hypothetical protein F5051DRAFT_226369 [Lentinula edodes]|nr:hypothetical protein F5051DRAFT_226369 [Lentinula edodes]
MQNVVECLLVDFAKLRDGSDRCANIFRYAMSFSDNRLGIIMSPTQQAIVVTGASGYVGSYITYQLLEDGYKVKGVARGEKVSFLQNAFARYPAFEAVKITDIASGDFSFMKGMDAVIHCAAPMISDKVDHETALKVFRSSNCQIIN